MQTRIDAVKLLGPAACAGCPIRNRSLCNALSPQKIQALNAISRRVQLEEGESFSIEGDEEVAFANVVEGVLKLARVMEDGREQVVGLLFASDFLGRPNRPAGDSQPFSVQAAGPVELCVFRKKPFEDLLKTYPELESELLSRAFDGLDAMREWMLMLGRKTARERVASLLHHMAVRCRDANCQPSDGFTLPMTRADMADFTGLTIETVSRQVSKLRKENVLVLSGTRAVDTIAMGRLRNIAEGVDTL